MSSSGRVPFSISYKAGPVNSHRFCLSENLYPSFLKNSFAKYSNFGWQGFFSLWTCHPTLSLPERFLLSKLWIGLWGSFVHTGSLFFFSSCCCCCFKNFLSDFWQLDLMCFRVELFKFSLLEVHESGCLFSSLDLGIF